MSTFIDSPVNSDVTGVQIQVSDELVPTPETKYAISSAGQAASICRSLEQAWVDGIANSTMITAQLNGQPPRSVSHLKNFGRGWYPNVNTGFLRTECNKIPSRYSTPILTAQSLTPAQLPPNWPDGAAKSQMWRDAFTEMVRRWDKWQWFVEQAGREAGIFGFGFAVWFDEWDWRPTFVRQDQGFVPVGTTVFDEIPFFSVRYDYQVWELIEIVEKAQAAKMKGWDLEAVAAAINDAGPKAKDSTDTNARRYEEMVRQVMIGQAFEEGFNTIKTNHLYSKDPDGTVSHHIVLRDDQGTASSNDSQKDDTAIKPKSLFLRRKQFNAMAEVVMPLVANVDDGTIHGSQGVGQLLFELSIEFEKSFNDWMAANKMVAKIKAQTDQGKNADEVRLKVEDYLMILQGATFAGNTAAVTTDPKPFQALQQSIALAASSKIGDSVPPIPLTPNDIRSAQVDSKVKEQQESREQNLHRWLMQWGRLLRNISLRAAKKDTPDAQAEAFQKLMKLTLSGEEVMILADPMPQQSIYDFTTYAVEKKAAFAASKQGNPYFDQRQIERVQAIAAGGVAYADSIMNPGSDPTGEKQARRQQMLETTTLRTGKPVDVLVTDSDYVHMQALRPDLEEVVLSGAFDLAGVMLNHYVQHYVGGMAKKAIPGDGNSEKQFIFKVQKILETGEIPPEGLADDPNLINQIEQQMALGPTQTPSQNPETAEMGLDSEAGAMAMIEGA